MVAGVVAWHVEGEYIVVLAVEVFLRIPILFGTFAAEGEEPWQGVVEDDLVVALVGDDDALVVIFASAAGETWSSLRSNIRDDDRS